MNLSKFLSTIIIVLLTAASTTAAAARQRRHEGQDTCKAKYSIGGTADLVIADGTLLYPDSKDQCHYGVQLLAEGATDIRIKCCVKKTCGKDLVGVCQDKHKNCKGSIVVGRETCAMGGLRIYGSCVFGTATDMEAEIENPCPAAGQCCIPYCKTGSPETLCKDSPGDPCCTNTKIQSSLPSNLLLNNNNDNENGNHDLSSPSFLLQQQQLQSSIPQDPSFSSSSSSESLPTDTSPTMVQSDRFQDNNALGMNHAENRFTVGWKSNKAGGDDDDDVPADWKLTS